MTEDHELLAQLQQLLSDARERDDVDAVTQHESDIAKLFPGEATSGGVADT
jgi:hypothetical protein